MALQDEVGVMLEGVTEELAQEVSHEQQHLMLMQGQVDKHTHQVGGCCASGWCGTVGEMWGIPPVRCFATV